jgi:hypothetical protein
MKQSEQKRRQRRKKKSRAYFVETELMMLSFLISLCIARENMTLV